MLTVDELQSLTILERYEYAELLTAAEDHQNAKWELTPRQQYAYDLADEVDELLYGGAAGGGKTELALYRCFMKSVQIPDHRTLYLRRSFPELRRTIIPRSRMRFGEHNGVTPTWRAADKEWHFSNGSIIELGYVDGDLTVYQYDSAEYDMLIIDEASEFSEFEIRFLIGRLRTTFAKMAHGARPHTVLMSNPGGIGHVNLRDSYVIPSDYGRSTFKWETIPGDEESVRTAAFVPAKVADNPHIDPDYVRNLKQLTEKLRRQRLDGDWDIFDGQYFQEFSTDTHVVDPYDIPKNWRKVRGIDYGYTNPAVCLWVAFNYDGDAVVYREWSGTQLTPVEQARAILAATPKGEKVDYTVADPSMWAHKESHKSVADQYSKAGLRLRAGDNNRIAGWLTVREHLRLREEEDGELVEGTPALTIFRGCQMLRKTLPALIHDPKKPDDLDTRGPDHWADTLRYILQSSHRRSRRPVNKPKQDMDKASLRAYEHRMRSAKRRSTDHPDLGRI